MQPATLVFTDVVDSTLLVERLGDERAAQVWAAHDRCARDLLALHAGREIDRTDGFFLLFDAVADAARYAMAYHEALAGLELSARVGLHVGPVTQRENPAHDVARGAKRIEVEGLAKPFAARIMALARGGQTLLSAAARAALGEGVPEAAVIESHGHYRLKGVEAPVEVFELGLRGAAAFLPPPDADKAYRVVRSAEPWRPLREVRHNLPAERDAFVGRSTELRALAQRLDAGTRLLTVLGPGGTGKTRFVRRYALAWLGDWPGGVYFCDLSEARSADGIFFAVASALGVPLGKADPAVQLGHAIAGRGRCLLILDNFEQLVTHAPGTLGHWLDRAPEAAFIVTSRERLHLGGEEVFTVEPLAIASEAIELFEVRARAQRPDFRLGDDNRSAVAEVVRLLDGLPLAIELAAARVRVLSPAQIVERMADRFHLLAGARGAAARQATLKAAIDWSWDLLTPWEQAALAQCSVFEGGFTLDAAEDVLDLGRWPEAPPVMDAVQALVDKSLLRTWSQAGAGRYDIDEPYFGMYISIYEYAVEKLGASGAEAHERAEERHGRYFAGFGSEASLQAFVRHGGVRRLRALALELDNLVAACRRAVRRQDGETAVATYRAAWEVLDQQGPFALGDSLGAQVLGLPGISTGLRATAGATRALALWRSGHVDEASAAFDQALGDARALVGRRLEWRVLAGLGNLRREQGRSDEARSLYQAALALLREAGDRQAEGSVMANLANLHAERGEGEEGLLHYEPALAMARDVGDRLAEGSILGNLGNVHFEHGRMDVGRAHFEAALAIAREVGNRRGEASVLGNLGNLCFDQGWTAQAHAFYDQALAVNRELGSRRAEGLVLGNLGNLHFQEGRLDEAGAHYQTALAMAREVGSRRDEGFVLGNLATLQAEQGRFAAAWECYEQALVIHRAIRDRGSEGAALGGMADVLLRQGRLGEAATVLDACETVLQRADEPMLSGIVRCYRGQAEVGAGNLDAARAALAEAEAAAAALHAEPNAEICRAIAKLRNALA
ncbi:MAG: tetratricopeptide repeat protein [Rhizobacter sp.]|nr:tetratricopeptide repeat protein [Rhizobacter sp.]